MTWQDRSCGEGQEEGRPGRVCWLDKSRPFSVDTSGAWSLGLDETLRPKCGQEGRQSRVQKQGFLLRRMLMVLI